MISVVTLACNRLEYTIRHIDSIIRRAGQPYEHVVVNNASSDGTKEWLDYAAKLPRFRHLKPVHLKENRGIWAGYTAGLDAASNDLVLFSDNDVEIHTPNALAKMAEPLAEHPICQASFTVTPTWRNKVVVDYPVAFFIMPRKHFVREFKLPDDYAHSPLKTFKTKSVLAAHIDGTPVDGGEAVSKLKYPPEIVYSHLVGGCPMGKPPFRKPAPKRSACWIVTHERSGSTLLCELLNNAGANPQFAEYFNQVYPDSYRTFLTTPVNFSNCKLMPAQFRLHGMSKAEITDRLPGLKFIHLRRTDRHAQAVSLYFCLQTHKWFSTANPSQAATELSCAFTSPDEYAKTVIPYDKNKLLAAYQQVVRDEGFWNEFIAGEQCMEIEHNDLVTNPDATLTRAANFLDMNLTAEQIRTAYATVKTHPMTRPETAEYIDRLKTMLRPKFI